MKGNGAAIRALRERTGLTKTQLAKATNMDRTYLHRIESGERNGTPAQLVAIASALKVPLTVVAILDPAEAVA